MFYSVNQGLSYEMLLTAALYILTLNNLRGLDRNEHLDSISLF